MGLHKEAIVIYDKALDLYNSDSVIIANKAHSLNKIGEFEESKKLFERAIMLDPQNKEIITLSETVKNKIDQESKKDSTTQTTSKSLFSKGGGCLIATATYGSELAPQVQQLRELRDNQLLNTESGTAFMNSFNDFYYSFSPHIADYERENPVFKEVVKLTITPMISSLSILNYVDMDSESEVLGYGISLIILNLMMYAGVPVIVILRFRK